jgi:adenylate kinase
MPLRREVLTRCGDVALVIAGTPGVGKTSVAQRLSQRTGRRYLNLANLIVENQLYAGFDEERKAYVVDTRRCREYLSQVLTCREVLDTHVVEAVPPSKVSQVFVLRLNPIQLRERLRARGYPERKIQENVEAEVLGVVLVDAVNHFGEERVCEVDTTGLSVDEVVQVILDALAREEIMKNLRPGSVDWLEKYHHLLH